MNHRYTDSVGVRLILIFFATVLLVRVRGQDEASSICAAEGSWKTNMCAKETDFYGDVTCRERLIVLSEEGEEIDVLATIVELKSELSIVRSQNSELRNRLSHVESTVMPSPPPPSPPPNPPPPPSPPPNLPPNPPPSPPPPVTPIPDASWHAFVAECLAESGAEVTGECTEWASGYNYGTMPNWDTSLVEDMSGYDVVKSVFQGFSQKSTFNGDISRWNTEKVTTMYYMFHSASAFNQDIGDWNTEKVTTMSWMFRAASAFNEDIGSWNTAQVTDMRSMFNAASAFNQDIGSWNTEKVNSMQWMFKEASSFNHDIGSWNTEKVTNMQYMFSSASAFDQDISSWTGTAATTNQNYMFQYATAFQAKFACTTTYNGPASSCVLK